jgi:hypothetical protein
MTSMRRPFAALLLILAGAAVPVRLWARHHEDAASLTAHIEREKNPIKKAKLEIRLSKLELEQAVGSYDHHQLDSGKQQLAAFLGRVQDAWGHLKSSGRNAASKPDGFMQLEIALREDARSLNDLRERVAYFNRVPIDQAIQQLNQLHSEVLIALFPGAAPPAAAHAKNSKMEASRLTQRSAKP